MDVENKYLVAIRCLTYNQSAYITDALDGFVMQQTSFPFVAMVVDDASTDDEQKLLRDYFNNNFDTQDTGVAYQNNTEYGTVLFARHKTNKNCFFAILLLKENHRSRGKGKKKYLTPWMEEAEFVALCEGDDYWTDPCKLQKQVGFLKEHQDYGLCYSDFDLFDEVSGQYSRAVFENEIYKRPFTFEEHLVKCGYIAPMSWLYRKSVYDSLEYKAFTDATFAYALAFFKQSKVYYLPEVTCVYRAHPNSLSRPTGAKLYFRQYKGVFDTQMYFAEKYQVSEDLVKLIKSGSYVRLLPTAIQSKQSEFIEEAADFFKENNINFDEILKLSKDYLQARQDSRNARKTHAYKIGKAILKPVERVKRIKQLFK